jgi:tetratricopeptide (TPR) repeat protein
MTHLGEMVMRIMEATFYTDVLIKKLPFDRSLYADAAARMLTIAQYERCLTYLAPLTQRFPEQRGLYLRRMADVQLKLSQKYAKDDDDEREELYEELAEDSLHESLNVENNFDAHMSLVELLIDNPDELDHTEKHLLEAKELMTDSDQEAHIEMHLGQVATEREQHEEALSHYQRVLELRSDSDAWFDVGEAQEALGRFDEAEASYKRALELEPDAIGYYYTLSELYSKTGRRSEAIEAIEQGIAANPDSAVLLIYLAAIYIEDGDYHQAELHVSKAEQIDPESELVIGYRHILDLQKPKRTYTPHKLNQPLKQKKKRR